MIHCAYVFICLPFSHRLFIYFSDYYFSIIFSKALFLATIDYLFILDFLFGFMVEAFIECIDYEAVNDKLSYELNLFYYNIN